MKKFIIYLCTFALFALLSLSLCSKAIDIGNNLKDIHPSVEIIYYVLLVIVLFFLVLRPLFIVVFAPYYSINNLLDNKFNHNKRIAKNLIKRNILSEKDSFELSLLINESNNDSLNNKLKDIYNNEIKKKINDIVIKNSKETMFLTSLSQSGTFDSIIVLINNFRLVKKIIVLCGFRPDFIRLSKLYFNILISTFIAEGLEKIDISSLISSSLQGTGKIVTNSLINGVSNGFLMLRVGMLTKLYLYASDPKKDNISLKNNALLEASKLLPAFISELVFGTVSSVVSSIGKVFNKEKKEKINQ